MTRESGDQQKLGFHPSVDTGPEFDQIAKEKPGQYAKDKLGQIVKKIHLSKILSDVTSSTVTLKKVVENIIL